MPLLAPKMGFSYRYYVVGYMYCVGDPFWIWVSQWVSYWRQPNHAVAELGGGGGGGSKVGRRRWRGIWAGVQGFGGRETTMEAAAMTANWSNKELGLGLERVESGIWAKKITANEPFSFSFSHEWVLSRFEPARQRHGPIPTEGWSSLLIYRDSWFDSTGKYLYWPIVHCKKHIYRHLICWLAIPTNGSTLLVYL